MKKFLMAIAAGGALFAFSAGAAFADTTVYDAIPATLAPNYPSQPFQAQQTNEFGDYVHLAGTARLLSTVSFTMSDWAVASSPENVTFCATAGNCDSTGFFWPITVNVYSNHLGANGAPDQLLATKTVTQHITWRPATSANCTGASAGDWQASDNNCYGGIAQNITFDLSNLGVTLPNDVIVTLAYNTETYGATPVGVDGPYDSLNVAVPPGDPVTLGTDDSADQVFWNTDTVSDYTNPSCHGGTLCEDTNWTSYGTVAMQITAIAPSVTTDPTTGETMTDATLNGTNGPVDAQAESFWVSMNPINTSSATIPVGVYSTLPLSAVTAGQNFSASLAALTAPNGAYVNGQVLGSMPAVVPGATYYVVAWSEVGGNWYPGQVLSFVVPMTAGSCPAGTVQSKTPLETVSVNSSSDTPTLSSHSLANGTHYVLVSTGTWQNGGLNAVDSMYASLDNWTTYQEGYDTTPYFLGPEEFNLEVNGAFTDWGLYSSPAHSYQDLVTGTGSKANFLVFDGNSNDGSSSINPSWYGDNTGTLSVAIYQCAKPSTITVTNNNTGTVTVTTTSSSNSGGNTVTGNSNGGNKGGGKGGSTTVKTGKSSSSATSVTVVNTNVTKIKKH